MASSQLLISTPHLHVSSLQTQRSSYSNLPSFFQGSIFVFAYQTLDHPLNRHAIRRTHQDRLVTRICRLESYLIALLVEPLQRRVASIDERNHHLTVVSRLSRLDYYAVAFSYLFADHRVASHAKPEEALAAHEVPRHADGFMIQDRFYRLTCRDDAKHRNLERLLRSLFSHHLDAAADVWDSLYQAFAFESRQNVVNASRRA